jgi:acid phosphatase (class A)
MAARISCALFALATALAVVPAHADEAPKVKPARWLDPQVFAPERVLATPPAVGSPEEKAEMATVRAFATLVSPARRAAAAADSDDETPHAFAAATGRDLAALPATKHLLEEVEDDVEAVTDRAKRYFHRPRPYSVDPTLAHCGSGKGSERSYPSGHAGFAWSMAWVLADLIPDRAPAIFARAEDFGYSREICGVHYPSDVEAGHVLGVLTARALLADPRLAADIAAARAELAKH